MLILCCLAAGGLAVLHLIIGYFWDKKWLGILPILSYLCIAGGMMTCFCDVARRAQTGDISGLLDIYPDITGSFVLVLGAVTVFHLLALLVRGKGELHAYETTL